MTCKYFAPNGQPSKLFDDLYSFYSNYMDKVAAEKYAVRDWLFTKSDGFKQQTAEWKTFIVESTDKELISRAKVAFRESGKKNPIVTMFKENPMQAMQFIYDQMESGNEGSLLTKVPHKVLIIAVKMFSGKGTGDIVDFQDGNGEAVLKQYTNANGKSSIFFSKNYREDIKIPFFDGEDGKTVYLELEGEESYVSGKINFYQSRGLSVDSIQEANEKTYIVGTIENEDLYFNDDVLDDVDTAPVSEYLLDKDNSSRILKSVIRNPVNPENQAIATQIALAVRIQPAIHLLTREEINEKYPSVAKKGIVNMFYNAGKHMIVVNKDIQINAAEFENIMLEELIHANTAYQINTSDALAQQWANQYNDAKAAMDNAKIDSRYMINSTEFLYGILRDKAFRTQLQRVSIPGDTNSTFLNGVMNWLLKLFGLRRNQSENVNRMLDMANVVLKRSLNPAETSYMADVVPNDELNPQDQGDLNKAEEETVAAAGTTVNVAEAGELFTGNKLFDTYIEALMEKKLSLRKSKQQKVGKDRKRTIDKESLLYGKHLTELQDNMTYAQLIRIGRVETTIMEKHIDSVNSLAEISENLKLLEAWRDFSSLIIKDAKAEGVELDKEVMFHVNAVSSTATNLYSQYYDKLFDEFKAGMAAEHVPPSIIDGINIDMTINDIGALAASFIGLSYGQNPIEQVADFLMRKSANNTNTEWIDWEKTYNDHLAKVGKDISFMFNTDKDGKRTLMTRYSPEMHRKMMDMRREIYTFDTERKPIVAKIKQLKKDFFNAKKANNRELAEDISTELDALQKQIDEHKEQTKSWDDYYEFMRQNFTYNLELSEEDNQRWEEFQENLRESYMDILEEDGMINEYAYQQELSKYDPQRFINWVKTGVDRPSHAAMWFKATPKKQWENSDFFNKLTNDQRAFYDFFTEEFIKGQENIPQEDPWFGEYEMDKILREFSFFDEKGLDKMKYLSATLKDWSKDLFTVQYQESTESNALKAPLSKRPVESIRFKKIGDFINTKAGYVTKEKITPKQEELVKKGVYKYNEDGYLVKSNNDRLVQNIVQDKVDPLKVFTEFKKMSLAYKYKRQVEDYLNTAKELAFNAEVVQETTDGRVIKKFGKAFTAKGKNNLDARLQHTIDAYLYSKTKDPFNAKAGKPGERQFSVEQTLETINNFTRVRQLGLNWASGITNLAMGTIGNWQYASRDEFFNEKELRQAYWKLKSSIGKFVTGGKVVTEDSMKIMMFIRRFNIFGSFQEEFFLNTKTMSELFSHLFVFQKGGEFLNQGATMVAMMMRDKLKNADGTEYKGKNGGPVSLWDAYDVKDGRLVLKYPDALIAKEGELDKFANAVLKVNKEIHGDYDPLNPQLIKKKQIGRILMMFRTWMPMSIKSRMGKKYRDYQLSDYAGKDIFREGRWRTAGRAFSEGGIGAGLKNGLRFTAAIMANTVSNKLGRKVIDTMGLKEEDKMNMYMNLKEAWWLAAIATVGALLKKSLDDDDDKDPQMESFLTYLYNQSSRLDNDLWFYYNPISAYKVVRDPVAIGSTFKQAIKTFAAGKNYIFDNESDTYTRGFRKGDSKFYTQFRMFLPLIRQVDSFFSMVEQPYSDQLQ